MRLAICRAVAVESSRGWKISKHKQTHKIDVVVALAMAAYAAVTCTDARSYYNLDALSGMTDDDPDGSKAFHMLRFMDHIRRYG